MSLKGQEIILKREGILGLEDSMRKEHDQRESQESE